MVGRTMALEQVWSDSNSSFYFPNYVIYLSEL